MKNTFSIILFLLLSLPCFAQGYWEYYGEKEGLSEANVTCFLRDKDNYLWIGTENGLNRWDGYHFDVFLPENRNKNSLSDAFISDLVQDSTGNIWIATHKGLNIFSPKTQTFQAIFHHDSLPFSLPNNWINSLFIAGNQEVWLACDNRDLVKYDPQTQQFIPMNWRPFCLSHIEAAQKMDYISILKITLKNPETIYLYTTIGVFEFDIKENTPVFLGKKAYSADSLITLKDKQGLLWKKTAKGFAKWDASLQHFEAISPQIVSLKFPIPNLPFENTHNYIVDAEKDAAGNIWIGTSDEGIFIWNPNTKKIRQLNKKEDHFISTDVSDLYWDEDKEVMWIATWDYGLYQYLAKKDSFILHQYDEQDTCSLSAFVTHQIAEDSKGNIWIATEPGGISIYNYKKKGFSHLSTTNGLPSNTIFGLISDKQGKIWISTSKGLAKIDPISYKVRTYTEKDGIPSEIDLKNQLYIDNFGYISLFSYEKERKKEKYIYGFRFLPQNLAVPFFPTQIHLSDFQVFDKPFSLPTNPNFAQEIVLRYDQNVFSFHFSNPDLHRSELHTYFYKLENYDKDWTKATNRTARYDHVPPGDYTFLLKTSNADGQENPIIKQIALHITPPFWQRMWFRLLIVGLIIAIIALLYHWRVQQIEKEISLQKERENLKTIFEKQLAEQKMSALRAQMNPHFIFNVLSSIGNFIIYKETEKALDFLQTFSQLIRRVLENSRSNFVSLREELDTAKMFLQIEQQRFQDKFLYFVEIDANVDIDFIEIPPMLLQPYIENAIWHGLMHKENTDRKIWLRILQKADFVQIEIEDNGIGRAKAAELKSKKADLHKSYGMKVTDERIALVNQISLQHQWKLEIHDLFDAEGRASGTKVLLF